MRVRLAATAFLLLCLALVLPMAAAQIPSGVSAYDDLALDARLEQSMFLVVQGQPRGGFPEAARFSFTSADLSFGSRHQDQAADFHKILVDLFYTTPGATDHGWTTPQPSPREANNFAPFWLNGTFDVMPSVTADLFEVEGIARFTLMRANDPEVNVVVDVPWRVRLAPQPNVQIEVVGGDENARPDQDVQFTVRLTNLDHYGASYKITARVVDADGIPGSQMHIYGAGSYFLLPYQSIEIPMGFRTPGEKFWYGGVQAIVSLVAEPADGLGSQRIATHIVEIRGVYVDENGVLVVVAFLAQLALLVLLIVFARRRYERRYLGRPIPPWALPEEAAMLRRLKQEAPRGFYVTRYFLMEEEYRSALLWFFAYKKLSKRQLKAEIRAIALREKADEVAEVPAARFDKALERLERRYTRRIERRQLWVEKRIERLQSRLERTFEKDHEKDHQKWEEKVEKVQKKYNKPYLKAKKKWDAKTKKILAKWEKPFGKAKAKNAKQLEAAKEKYAKIVKKKDKPTWRAWREQMEDWEQESKLRKKEGREPVPEPPLLSSVVGPADLPPPFQEPPRPELPPEPVPDTNVPLPPEPKLETPTLAASHYAKDVRKVERKGRRKIRKLELKLAQSVDEIIRKSGEAGRDAARKRARLLRDAQATGRPGFVDRVLRRTPESMEQRHQVAFARGLADQRIKEAREIERGRVERVRLENQRAEAALEAESIRHATALNLATKSHDAVAREREIASAAELKIRLADLRKANAERLAAEEAQSKTRLADRLAAIERETQEAIQRASEKRSVAAPAAPTES